jgi:hypothetical protein
VERGAQSDRNLARLGDRLCEEENVVGSNCFEKRSHVCSLCTFYRRVTSVVGLSQTVEVRISLDTVIH